MDKRKGGKIFWVLLLNEMLKDNSEEMKEREKDHKAFYRKIFRNNFNEVRKGKILFPYCEESWNNCVK